MNWRPSFTRGPLQRAREVNIHMQCCSCAEQLFVHSRVRSIGLYNTETGTVPYLPWLRKMEYCHDLANVDRDHPSLAMLTLEEPNLKRENNPTRWNASKHVLLSKPSELELLKL